MRTVRCSSRPLGGVCPGECLPGVCVAQHALRQFPPERNDWLTGVKTLPCRNFVVDGNHIHLIAIEVFVAKKKHVWMNWFAHLDYLSCCCMMVFMFRIAFIVDSCHWDNNCTFLLTCSQEFVEIRCIFTSRQRSCGKVFFQLYVSLSNRIGLRVTTKDLFRLIYSGIPLAPPLPSYYSISVKWVRKSKFGYLSSKLTNLKIILLVH